MAESSSSLPDFWGSGGRELSEITEHSTRKRAALPGVSTRTHVSGDEPSILKSYHLSMLFSLADGFREEAINTADLALANNLRNLRDLDIGVFPDITQFVGRGATFSVQRTMFPDSQDVALKTRVSRGKDDTEKSLMERLEAILLELRVLTHPPLRHHQNIVQLLCIGWQGDSEDLSLKWPVLVVDYADSGTLADIFEDGTTMGFYSKISLFQDITKGLHALHSCKIVHGDLKLENILLFTNEKGGYTAKLSDFGGALLDDPEGFQEPMGTPPWTAPEYKTKRPRDQLLLSDVYSLGLLLWRIALDGQNPFHDLAVRAPAESKEAVEFMPALKHSDDFVHLVKRNLRHLKRFSSLELDLVDAILEKTIRFHPSDRSLESVIRVLRDGYPSELQSELKESTKERDNPPLETDDETESDPDSEPRLCMTLGGLEFAGATRALSGHVLQAFEHTAEHDVDPEKRMEAASILWRMHLGADDLGIGQDVDKGLHFLTKCAENGCEEEQALILRLHHAFGRDVPHYLQSLLPGWLAGAAATGSLTAMEDLARFGFESELQEAKANLRGRYCGFGHEVFEYEQEAFNLLQDPLGDGGRSYLNAELLTGRVDDNDLRGYFLRLSAAYGGVDAVTYLVQELGTDINDANQVGDRALLLAARSGHKDVLLKLLRLGADPGRGDQGNDTPLHWLCSFDDEDIDEAAEQLVRHGADIDAQADTFPASGRLPYAETEFVAGTPLHRAICRSKLHAVRKLLRMGARLDAAPQDAINDTPLALAALLHYPNILTECLRHRPSCKSRELVTPGGQSLLIPTLQGGSVHKAQIGRLIRHGDQWRNRALDTLKLLCDYGVTAHFDSLPGQPDCTALFFASRYQPHIVEFLALNGANLHVNSLSKRFENEESSDQDPEMLRPPLQEAILYGKPLVALKLLELGADASQGMNNVLPTSALYECALASLEDLSLAEELCRRGNGVDDGPVNYETPFMLAVRNGCFVLAGFLRCRGANVNALCTRGYMWSSSTPHTLLFTLLRTNRPASLSGLSFLLSQERRIERVSEVNIIANPERNHTAFHVIAMLDGDTSDRDTTVRAMQLCEQYFTPSADVLNMKSFPYPDWLASRGETGIRIVAEAGGNTALHYAALKANLEAVNHLLDIGADPALTNELGMTALDIAALSYPGFEQRYPTGAGIRRRKRQLSAARSRRDRITTLLTAATPGGVKSEILNQLSLER